MKFKILNNFYFQSPHEMYLLRNFNDAHKLLKKRRLIIGPAKAKVIDSIFNVGLSCETYRENEAERLMKIGRYLVMYVFKL